MVGDAGDPAVRADQLQPPLPGEVELARVPESLWWRIGIMCLHAHWPLLRECRVMLPVRLPPGEAETWLRLTYAAVATLEVHVGGEPGARSIEIVERRPRAAATGRPTPIVTTGGVVAALQWGPRRHPGGDAATSWARRRRW